MANGLKFYAHFLWYPPRLHLHPVDSARHTAMVRLAANLSFLFKERPFLDGFQAAAAAGFRAVPYTPQRLTLPYRTPALPRALTPCPYRCADRVMFPGDRKYITCADEVAERLSMSTN